MESAVVKTLKSRSKRRRRRRRHQSDKEIPEIKSISSSASTQSPRSSSQTTIINSLRKSILGPTLGGYEGAIVRKISDTLLRGSCSTTLTTLMLLAIILLVHASELSASSPCDKDSWWDSFKDRCILCTVCHGDMIPLRPCQLHRDTICGSIYDLTIDWVVLAKTEPNWKERRKADGATATASASATAYGLSPLSQHLTSEELQKFHENSISMDWKTGVLFAVVLACLLFFIVAACILIHHMRQWRRMERRLDQDVEELSTKLMAKLAEVQNLEGGTFFIGNADALQIPTTFQPQHVLLPSEKSLKHHSHHYDQSQHDRRYVRTAQPGNVYIENAAKVI